METCGIIAEYNPFHSGHQHQIREIRRRLGPNTGVIAAMSGDFVQRGGPAVVNKWQRAAWAVRHGVDLVLELPVTFASASAERFAAGGVRLLDALGIVRHLAFGAETGDLDGLSAIAALLAEEPPAFKAALNDRIGEQAGFAAARASAVGDLLGSDAAHLLKQSNAILAVSYLIAIRRYSAGLSPLLVERQGPGEHATGTDGRFMSASRIRTILTDAFAANRPADALALLPVLPHDVLGGLLQAGFNDGFNTFGRLFGHVLPRLVAEDADALLDVSGMRPDLAMRLKNMAADRIDASDAERFIDTAATRAYPASRVRRALTQLYLGQAFAPNGIDDSPSVIHVLAVSKRGRHLLRLMKTHARLPLVTRSSDVYELSGAARLELARSQRAADLYALLLGQPTRADFDQRVTIV